jgi:hypothetical protein
VARRACWAGSNRNYVDPADGLLKFVLWSLNLDAPTPKAAWQHSIPAGSTLWNNTAQARSDVGFPGWAALSDSEAYVHSINAGGVNCVFNVFTQAIRQASKSLDPWGRGDLPAGGQYLFLRRAGNRIYYATNDGTGPRFNVRYFDIETGRVVQTGALAPAWYIPAGSGYSTIAATPAGHVLGWQGRKEVWHYNRASGAMNSWETSGPRDPIYPVSGTGENGIMGKWVHCSGTTPGCFLGITACNKNVHVFRPPAAWNVG